jgi:hypothetical protein
MDRSALGFNKCVKKYFNYLLSEYGYIIAKEEVTLVSFKRNKMEITIYHGRQSYEIGMEITFSDGKMATLYEILKVMAPEDSKKIVKMASNKKTVEISLLEISCIFKARCGDLLRDKLDENRIFKKISDNRKKYSSVYQYGALKDKAEIAWQNKNYPEAKEIYMSISDHLDEKERRRLAYLKLKT